MKKVKVIICKVSDRCDEYDSVTRIIDAADFAEVSDDDYRLLEQYIRSRCDLVMLTLETPQRVAEFIELAREHLKKEQEARERNIEKRAAREKKREAREKNLQTQRLKEAIELLRKEGIAVESEK